MNQLLRRGGDCVRVPAIFTLALIITVLSVLLRVALGQVIKEFFSIWGWGSLLFMQ